MQARPSVIHEPINPDIKSAFVLPDASTPAANRPVVAILAGKRTVSHSRSGIRSAIAHRLNACVRPAEIYRFQGAAEGGRRAIVIVATKWPIVLR